MDYPSIAKHWVIGTAFAVLAIAQGQPVPVSPPIVYIITSGSGSAYAYTVQPAFAPIVGTMVSFKADVTNTGPATLQLSPMAAVSLKKLQGSANLAAGDIQAGGIVTVVYDGTLWQIQSPIATAPFVTPSGTISLITSGTCSTGWSQVTALDGVTVIGTLAAHGDVGTTGGSDTITPTGSVAAPVFTGTSNQTTSATSAGTPAGTVSQPTLTMNSYTPAGTNGTSTVTPTGTVAWPVGVPVFTGSSGTVPAETFTGSAGTVGAQTFTGSAGTVSAATISWPAGVPTFAGTPGTVPAQTFTGSSATTSSNSAGTPAGTNGASATSGNCAATNIAAGTGSTTACKATAPNLTVTAQTFTGSALAGHTHTLTATGTNGTAAFTPAGANSWPAGVPTNGTTSFTPAGTNSTVSFTPAGTNGTVSFTPAGTNAWPMGVPTFNGNLNTVGAQTWTGQAATLTGAVSQPTFTGSALGTHTHTLTPAGTNNAPAFTGSQFDNRSSFVKVIFCSKD